MKHNPNCDGSHCRDEYGHVERLDTGGGSGVILCRDCWLHEMAWRIARNRELAPENQFELKPFPEA